jgi:hypothetical protein
MSENETEVINDEEVFDFNMINFKDRLKDHSITILAGMLANNSRAFRIDKAVPEALNIAINMHNYIDMIKLEATPINPEN